MADRNSIIEKIKALLSKTTENGCTEEEELSALAKARAWIDTHEISSDELRRMVALAVVVLAAAVTWRTELPRQIVAPGGIAPPSATSAEATPGAGNGVSLADDASLSLIAEMAGHLDWDAAAEAGLGTQADVVDRAVLELSANERLELQRILKEELSRSGV